MKNLLPTLTSSAFGLALGAMFMVPFLFGDSPLPPPYHRYFVQGSLQRLGGGPRQNFIASLVGKFPSAPMDTLELIVAVSSINSITKSVTDTAGEFSLDVNSLFSADSLAIKVAAFGKQDYISPFFRVLPANGTVIGVTPGAVSGCFGCTSTGPSTQYVKGYQYDLANQVVVLPY